MTKFCRFDLRTSDVDAARVFYTMLFGHDRAPIWQLHEQAVARGARPHWLGQIGVDDVEGTVAAFEARGAARLGPPRQLPGGGEAVHLRDPGGAVLAVGTPEPATETPAVDVRWHVLYANDLAKTTAAYRELFGWSASGGAASDPFGAVEPFAWTVGGPSVGAFADAAVRDGVHPSWTFFFEVDGLEPALAATRAAGGLVRDPVVLPDGRRLCVCQDPQGAQLGLRERLKRP